MNHQSKTTRCLWRSTSAKAFEASITSRQAQGSFCRLHSIKTSLATIGLVRARRANQTLQKPRSGDPDELMGRRTTFYDEQFRGDEWNANDPGEFERDLVFVGMPFAHEDMLEVYPAIKAECAKLGLNCVRADDSIGSGFVIRQITSLIERAEFLVIDLTHERPNVYYELGYAHGVGNESNDILLLARRESTLHFDVAPLRVQYYGNEMELRNIVSESMKRMIAATRRAQQT
jgi:hypothetical protein